MKKRAPTEEASAGPMKKRGPPAEFYKTRAKVRSLGYHVAREGVNPLQRAELSPADGGRAGNQLPEVAKTLPVKSKKGSNTQVSTEKLGFSNSRDGQAVSATETGKGSRVLAAFLCGRDQSADAVKARAQLTSKKVETADRVEHNCLRLL